MAVRVVIDVSEDELEKISKDAGLSAAFLNSVLGIKSKRTLGNGTTVSTATDITTSGTYSDNGGISWKQFDFAFGYGRYREDQADVVVHGVNGSSGECFVRKATPSTPKK
ncbi:MAG: hypothetical protein VYC19_10470 [Pseudomonadota bacterium]|jgi:hypothetical protein|nr:hypothetical protein [Pseudomonadota bacterium]MEC7703167.1 hypothetical protein [Pseudomonadota bacterium]MEC9236991.1 hypothetical protein [Pseudomonadota bacterium]